MDLLKTIVDCIAGRAEYSDGCDSDFAAFSRPKRALSVQDTANEILNTIFNADRNDRNPEHTTLGIVIECGFSWLDVAEAVFNGLAKALEQNAPMGTAVKDAFDKAVREATGFVQEHPFICTIIAIGILVIIAPWVLETLGFGAEGPIAGDYLPYF